MWLVVEATKVVHPGHWGEAVVTTHATSYPGAPNKRPQECAHDAARSGLTGASCPHRRVLPVHRVRTDGWRVGDAATAAGLSLRQAFRWLARYRAGGEPALQDRSSAPARCRRTDADTTGKIEYLRRQRRTGPRIARELDLPRSTVGLVLRRLGLGQLSALETKPEIVRCEHEKPGELIHIDIKKLGRMDGVGHRITGRRVA